MLNGILALVAGLLLLFFGRRLFWLAAALIAFLFVWQFLENLFGPGPISLLVAGVVGIVFAWLAVKFIKIATYIIGFLAGAVALPFLVGIFGFDISWFILALIGGVIGVIIVAVAFDWGLILITAWAGASAVSFALQNWMTVSETFDTVIFFGLLIVGIGWQASRRRKMV